MSHSQESFVSQHIEQGALVHAFAVVVGAAQAMLERAQHSRRDTWLASAADLGDLERRMRAAGTDD